MNSSGVTPRVPDSCAEQGRAALAHAMAPMLATTIANRSSDLSQQRSFAIIPHSQLQLTNRNSRLASRQQQITNHEEQLNHQSTNLANYQSRSPDAPICRSISTLPAAQTRPSNKARTTACSSAWQSAPGAVLRQAATCL